MIYYTEAVLINIREVIYISDGSSHYEIDSDTEEYPIDINGHLD